MKRNSRQFTFTYTYIFWFILSFLQVCGTARHGLVRLWDMRHAQPVQMYHVKHPRSGQSSPVYSVAFDQSNLYVALDQCLSLVSFVNPTCTSRKTNYYNNKVVYYRWKKIVKTMYSIGFCFKQMCYATRLESKQLVFISLKKENLLVWLNLDLQIVIWREKKSARHANLIFRKLTDEFIFNVKSQSIDLDSVIYQVSLFWHF